MVFVEVYGVFGDKGSELLSGYGQIIYVGRFQIL